MMFCNSFFPLKADIFYAVQTQNDFGEVDKAWNFDRTVRIDMNTSTNYKDQQMQPDQFFWMQDMLNGRVDSDVRVSLDGAMYSLTDILIANIRNDSETEIYFETAGPRTGMSTLFEVAGLLPHNDPWGRNDYHKLVLKRSELQELVD